MRLSCTYARGADRGREKERERERERRDLRACRLCERIVSLVTCVCAYKDVDVFDAARI